MNKQFKELRKSWKKIAELQLKDLENECDTLEDQLMEAQYRYQNLTSMFERMKNKRNVTREFLKLLKKTKEYCPI